VVGLGQSSDLYVSTAWISRDADRLGLELAAYMQLSGEDNGDSGRLDHEQARSVWAEGRPCRHQGGSEAVAPHNQARHYW